MNRALPEMLHCLNSTANIIAGNCTDMTVLERQRSAQLKWQQEQLQQQEGMSEAYFNGSDHHQLNGVFFNPSGQLPGFPGLVGGVSVIGDVAVNSPVKPDPGLENGWSSELDRFHMAGIGLGSPPAAAPSPATGLVNVSGFQITAGAISRTSSCPTTVAPVTAADVKAREAFSPEKEFSSAAGARSESFKKRKADKIHNTKVRHNQHVPKIFFIFFSL